MVPPLKKKQPTKKSTTKATNSNKKSRSKKSVSDPTNDSDGSSIEVKGPEEIVDADVE